MKFALFLLITFFSATLYAEEMTWGDKQYDNIYNDVKDHCQKWSYYKGDDKTGSVHEGTHGINSYLRNKYPNYDWFYVGNNTAFRVKIHNVQTLSQITKLVPQSERDHTYQLYLVKQLQWWNDTPSYVCEEWSAYYLGTLAAIDEYGHNSTRAKYSLRNTKKMLSYMKILEKLEGENKDLEVFMNFAEKKVGNLETLMNGR